MQQPDDGGMPSTTITSEVIKVVVTPLPESGGLALGDKIALGVGIPAAVFGGLGLFKWCFWAMFWGSPSLLCVYINVMHE